jgi:hypothetical protein
MRCPVGRRKQRRLPVCRVRSVSQVLCAIAFFLLLRRE